MSNHDLSLKEFICSIPICQPEADLGNMLNIFQHLNCHIVAIPQGNLGWGVINSENLLSLVAETFQGECIALSSHPRNTRHQQSMTHRLTPDVQTLIKPAIVYQHNTLIDDFLNSVQYESLVRDNKVCLIVNQQGELLGQLDQNRIIQYLASRLPLTSRKVARTVVNNVATLTRQIALPSKIETAAGKIVESNLLWQELVTEKQNDIPQITNFEPATESWISQPEYLQAQDTKNYQGDLNLESEFEQIESFDLSLKNNPNINSLSVVNWNYIRVPLNQNPPQTASSESYYLVLAIPSAKSESYQSDTSTHTPNSEVTTNQILASVSHELKSPLTGIVGLSTLLSEQKLGSLNQRQTRYAELIYRSGKKMMSVVDDLLEFTTFAANQSQELELINLELLCRQVYQEALTKVQLLAGQPDSIVRLTQPQLSIELGSEIAIANKPLLSSIISHLMLEVISVDATLEPLKIHINNPSGMTTIIMTTSRSFSLSNCGLNGMIAKYLSKLTHARLTYAETANNSQVILTLAKNKTKLLCPVNSVASQTSTTSVSTTNNNLTILHLHPELEVIDFQTNQEQESNFNLEHWSDNYDLQGKYQHRILEADSLEQAHNLARIWRLDAIILNGHQITQPSLYLQSLQKSEHLASLPLITLDTKTTEAANQIDGLNVYPCLLPARQCSIEDLIQVIQIAIES